MGNYNFRKDLKIAKKTEKEVAEILRNKYCFDIVEFGDTNAYDIKAVFYGIELTFEVKEDFFCHKSGNVALEFKCRGKLSGINTTQATGYIYKIHAKQGIIYVVQDVRQIKEKIKAKKYFRIVNGGDKGSNSMNYLFKLEEFIKGAICLDENGEVIS